MRRDGATTVPAAGGFLGVHASMIPAVTRDEASDPPEPVALSREAA